MGKQSHPKSDDSTLLSFLGCEQPKACFLTSAEVCVLWASTVVNKRGFQRNELLHIARGFARSEFSGSSVQVIVVRPFCLCRIYSNGRIVIMGNLTESQARKQLQRVIYKIRHRIKWKVSTGFEEVKHGNGLTWNYVDDPNIVPVKIAMNDFQVDQLYYKLAFNKSFDLPELLKKGLKYKYSIVVISPTCLRLHVDLPQDVEEDEHPVMDNTASVWEVGLELENELEAELVRIGRNNKHAATCIIYNSGKVAILGCVNSDQAMLTYSTLVKLL